MERKHHINFWYVIIAFMVVMTNIGHPTSTQKRRAAPSLFGVRGHFRIAYHLVHLHLHLI